MKIAHEQKFLGMILDKKLSWSSHITATKVKCMKAMKIIKCMLSQSWGADRTSLLRIYNALIKSKLDYGCQFYNSASKSILNKLNSIHHLAICLATEAFRTSPIPSLYAESGEPPLSARRDKLSLQLYSRVKAMPSTPVYKKVCNQADDHLFNNRRNHSTFGYRVRRLLDENEVDDINVVQALRYTHHPWTLLISPICPGIRDLTKSKTPDHILRSSHFGEMHYNSFVLGKLESSRSCPHTHFINC